MALVVLQVDDHVWEGFSDVYRFSKVLQVQTIAAESVLPDAWAICTEPLCRRFILLGLAIYAIKTQNMIAVLAVLAFNVSLVIGGLLEAAQRNWSFGRGRVFDAPPDFDGPSASRARSIDVLLWIIPAVDLGFHLGCDWAAFKVRSSSHPIESFYSECSSPSPGRSIRNWDVSVCRRLDAGLRLIIAHCSQGSSFERYFP